ncbi:hypothetical protein MRX96_043545 [Rhipicephalus microplus]
MNRKKFETLHSCPPGFVESHASNADGQPTDHYSRANVVVAGTSGAHETAGRHARRQNSHTQHSGADGLGNKNNHKKHRPVRETPAASTRVGARGRFALAPRATLGEERAPDGGAVGIAFPSFSSPSRTKGGKGNRAGASLFGHSSPSAFLPF